MKIKNLLVFYFSLVSSTLLFSQDSQKDNFFSNVEIEKLSLSKQESDMVNAITKKRIYESTQLMKVGDLFDLAADGFL